MPLTLVRYRRGNNGAIMKPISCFAAEHYIWGQNCEGWHLVKNAGLSVIQEQMPPGSHEVRHFHQKAQQFFYILSGEAVMEANDEKIVLHAGEGLHVPPGTPHQIQNPGARAVEFLVISQPPSHGDRKIPSRPGS
jgi:mannose-6-phosphate isomerase-like protein (cupin superfamily)